MTGRTRAALAPLVLSLAALACRDSSPGTSPGAAPAAAPAATRTSLPAEARPIVERFRKIVVLLEA